MRRIQVPLCALPAYVADARDSDIPAADVPLWWLDRAVGAGSSRAGQALAHRQVSEEIGCELSHTAFCRMPASLTASLDGIGRRTTYTSITVHPCGDSLPVLEQAVMVVADKRQSLTITGTGDVLEPFDGVIGESTYR